MFGARQAISDRLYGALLRVLPYEFRLEFGSDMEETFHMQWVETRREHGLGALLCMWWATIVDILHMAPREHAWVLWQDLRFALRMMRKNPGYTAAAVTILGLGIGVNTSIFSAVNSVLLKPLPYLRGDDLVIVRERAVKRGILNLRFSVPELEDFRKYNQTLAGIEEYHSMAFTLLGPREAHRVRTGVVSAGFFDLFGVRPLMGRTFVPDDDRPGAPPVLVLSYEYWKQTHGADPQIVGKVFQMNDRPHTVIGVLPPIPQYPDQNDVYMTTIACPSRSHPSTIASRDGRMMRVFGRRKAGVSIEQCQADMALVAERMRKDNPTYYTDDDGFEAGASPLRGELTERARPMLFALLGAAAFVLLIACANVANLTLARMARREQELVIRTAVGAGSGRLLRQLLTESSLMALLAAGVGILLAAGSIRLLAQFAGQLTERAREIAIDGRVLVFAIVCASLTTIVFGSLSALYSRRDVASGLKEGSRANAERKRRYVRSFLIAAQVAFSFVLLIGAGLLVRSLVQMNRVDGGFASQHVLAAGFQHNWTRYHSPEQLRQLSHRLLEEVEKQPGVVSAAISDSYPLDPELTDYRWSFVSEGDSRRETSMPAITSVRFASPGYFRTLGIPLVAGRYFLDSDGPGQPVVFLVNQSLARATWGDGPAVGHRISVNGRRSWGVVVGVVGDTKEFGLSRETPAQLYMAIDQEPRPGSIVVRTSQDPEVMGNRIRKAIKAVDSDTPVTQLATMEQARADSVSSPRTASQLFSLFAVLALVIAVAGIGSMLALWVRQRTHEFGIRLAMGARPQHILATVIRQGMVLVGIGLIAGLGGSITLTGFLRRFLFQVEPTDLFTYAMVSALFVVSALVACYIPARRAARIDPQTALRCD